MSRFSLTRRVSHRASLVSITVASSAILMGLVLAGAALLFRQREIGDQRRLMQTALSQLAEDLNESGKPDLEEANEAFPTITFSWFDSNGKLLKKAGGLSPVPTVGFRSFDSSGRIFLGDGIQEGPATISAMVDWTNRDAELNRMACVLALIWLLVQILVGVVSWGAAKATFKPLQDLTNQAAKLGGTDLSARLSSMDAAEFGQLTAQLNSLLDRIEQTARREEQFASDAAHELRTPLTSLLAGLETALLQVRSPDEYRRVIGSAVHEVERLAQLVELLLRSTRGVLEPAAALALKPVVESAAARWLDRFEESGVHLATHFHDVEANIAAEELGCVLDNLLDNALRYSPSGSTAYISLDRSQEMIRIRVSDEGPGVPSDLTAHIFERLATGETSRSRTAGGYGIGLALCRSIVTGRGGDISLSSNAQGGEFTVLLKSTQSP